MKQATDTAGNQLREVDGKWQILQQGIGWREFVGKTWLADGTCIDQTPTPPNGEGVEYQDNTENELFIHFAGLAMQGLAYRRKPKDSANLACQHAKALIDELKERVSCEDRKCKCNNII